MCVNSMSLKKFQMYHSREERMQVVTDYVNSGKTIAEIVQKYDINIRTLSRWIKEYKEILFNEKKVVSLHRESKTTDETMKYCSPEEEILALKEELSKTKKALAQSELKQKALEALIDVAEDAGIPIRKNSGAKR